MLAQSPLTLRTHFLLLSSRKNQFTEGWKKEMRKTQTLSSCSHDGESSDSGEEDPAGFVMSVTSTLIPEPVDVSPQ